MASRLPDQRHLRRAADAAAFEDTDKPVTVAVEIKDKPPFDAVVLDEGANVEAELDKLEEHTGFPWAAVPARTEKSAFRRKGISDKLYFILHDWWSPLVWYKNDAVQRDQVKSLSLVARDANGNVLADVNLNEVLIDGTDKQAAKVRPDAIFFSFEALDKFLFPQLANTYGVKGAWQERNRLRRELGDEVLTDADEEAEDRATDERTRNQLADRAPAGVQ